MSDGFAFDRAGLAVWICKEHTNPSLAVGFVKVEWMGSEEISFVFSLIYTLIVIEIPERIFSIS